MPAWSRAANSSRHKQARDLLNRRPGSSQAHHLMSYVLRYGGMLQESARECDTAAHLEPLRWAPCSSTYMELGDYVKARSVLREDLDSEWSRSHGIDILLRQGKTDVALRLAPPEIPGWDSYRMLLGCARHEPAAEIASMAQAAKPDDDPEVTYFFAAHLAYCGQAASSVRMLKHAIGGHYCSYPAIDIDPFFDRVRSMPAFKEARQSAIECESQFSKSVSSTQ